MFWSGMLGGWLLIWMFEGLGHGRSYWGDCGGSSFHG